MELKLMQMDSDYRAINKHYLSEITINSEPKIQWNDEEIELLFDTNANNVLNYNYMKWNGKFYFIRSITYVAHNVVNVKAVIDRRSTYAPQILAQTCVLKRSENIYNRYIPDNNLVTNAYKRVQTKVFPNSFSPIPNPILICTTKGDLV